MKYKAYGVGSYNPQSQYFAVGEIWKLIVEKNPHSKEAAAVELRSVAQIHRSISSILGDYDTKLGLFFSLRW